MRVRSRASADAAFGDQLGNAPAHAPDVVGPRGGQDRVQLHPAQPPQVADLSEVIGVHAGLTLSRLGRMVAKAT
jgi:hypothetical protein